MSGYQDNVSGSLASATMAFPFDIAEKISTPIGLAALALLVMSAAFLAIIRRDPHRQQIPLLKSVAGYTFVVSIIFGLVAMIGPIAGQWLNTEYRVSGTVFEENGGPIEFAEVTIVGGPTQETGEDGGFEIVIPRSRFPSGYTILVFDNKHVKYTEIVKEKYDAPHTIFLKKIENKTTLFDGINDLIVGHVVGMPFIQASFSTTNQNDFSIRIDSISATIRSPKGETFDLGRMNLLWSDPPPDLGKNYLRIGSKKIVQMTGWFLYSDPGFQVLNQRIMQEIQNTPVNMNPALAVIRISQELSEHLQSYAREHFALFPGSWELILTARLDDQVINRTFHFDLTTEEVEKIKTNVADYQYGFGILWGMWFAGKNGPQGQIHLTAKG